MTRYFWKNWTAEYRYTWYGVSLLFAIALLFVWFSYFRGNDAIIHWEKLQEQKVVESTVHTFQAGPFELAIPAENFVIFEYFNGSNLSPNTTASYLYLILVALSTVILLTIITTLDRFWFILGMVLFMLFMISLRLNVLTLFGQYNHIPVITLLVFVTAIAAYFNIFKPETGFKERLITFTLLAVITAVVIHFFSGVPYPMLHLAVTSYTAALILTVLFILLVAHEIMASFIFILSRNETGSKNLQHFLIISLIYLVNIVLTALHEAGTLQWSFVYLNLYLLLTLSGILGLWGFRDREPMFQNIFPFHPFGAFFYMAMGAIAFATVGGLLGNANDTALKVIRDIIIFSHFGFGIIFIFYVIANFINLLGQNKPVYKVLYKPTRMPYFTFQFAGLIATLAFVFYVGWRGYIYNSVAGFYSNLGDLDMTLGNTLLARAHYDQARSYGFRNHHANYALAKLKESSFNYEEVHRHYELANGRRPSPYSLINAGNIFIWQNQNFEAIKAYQQAREKYKDSGFAENNLGFAYSKVYNIDSAAYYLSLARKQTISSPTAEANFFAMAATEYLPINADSIIKAFGSQYAATLANALALANAQQQPFTATADPLSSQKLNLYSATLLNNYLVRHAKTIDSLSLGKAYRIANDSLNGDYSEALKVPIAVAYYHQNNVSRALEIMAELAFISQSYKGKYNYLMGLWALEQGSPELAASYFDYSVQQDYKDAKLYKAIALSEAGLAAEAGIAWDTVAASSDEAEREIAAAMKKILNINPSQTTSLTDIEKYQFCRYRLHVYDTALFNRIIPTFTDNNYKAKSLLDMAQRQFEWDELNRSIRYMNQLGGLELTDKGLYQEIQRFELLMLAERKELLKLAGQINSGIDFRLQDELQKVLYTAIIHESSGDTIQAEKNYRILAAYNPYFEEGIIAAAGFYRDHGDEYLKAYTILAEAVQINTHSIKLWNAYIREAFRMGFDNYAVSAIQQLEELRRRR